MRGVKEFIIIYLYPIATLFPVFTIALFLFDGAILPLLITGVYYFLSLWINAKSDALGGLLNIVLWIVGFVLCIVNLSRAFWWLIIYIVMFALCVIAGKLASRRF